MTSRRRWLRPSALSHPNSRYTCEYECLEEDSPPRHFSFTKPRRSGVVSTTSSSPTTTTWKSRTNLVRNDRPTAVLNDLPSSDIAYCTNSANYDGICNVNAPKCWPSVCVVTDERIWGKETDEDEEDEMFHFTKPFTEKYYASTHLKQKNDRESIVDSSDARSSCKKSVLFNMKVGLSQSFETQETQLEESSETSLCTTDDETDPSSKSASNETANEVKIRKHVQWPDEQSGGVLVTKVHALEYASELPYTCRVVILLLMDHGAQSEASNFEFLHCEFRQDDRLRVCDALPQITQLVLGTAPSDDSTSQPTEPFRPFTRLYLDGRELINTLALQDYYLEDGQSTLVALREPLVSSSSKDSSYKFTDKERRDALLRQSELLLADKRLRRGIRKARIAGRSLQILYGTQGMSEQKARLAEAREVFNVENDEPEEHESADTPDARSMFDSLARASFDSDDLKDTSSFDLDFFEGMNFFRQMALQSQHVSCEQNTRLQQLEITDCEHTFAAWAKSYDGLAELEEVECVFGSSRDLGYYEWPAEEEFVGAIDRQPDRELCDSALTEICS
jgi:hypothetical protein